MMMMNNERNEYKNDKLKKMIYNIYENNKVMKKNKIKGNY